ncbi:MAG: hypothetical protein PHV74_07875 [Dehalococcoidia bacterium]|nr:hypothetical protein [Dehalococcoidia bacterium]
MTQNDQDRLYNLLPSIYRIRDADQGEPLRSLLMIIQEQADALRKDIDGLYEDWFIETCADWVIPYIGELVGNRPLHEIKKARRTDVAKTIYYRRRKGTAAMLEEMARDVTGWGAHVVEFFKLMEWSQNLNHLRFSKSIDPPPGSPVSVDYVGTVNIRSRDVIDRIDGPFDVISHTADIRPICCWEGWHNIRKIGFFLWRLETYLLAAISPRPVPDHPHCFTFSRLGNMTPLFHEPQREDDDTGLAREIHVSGPIRPLAFDIDLKAYDPDDGSGSSDYYGHDRGLSITKNGKPVPPEDIVSMDLSSFGCPDAGKVAIDVKHGLLGFAPGEEPSAPANLAKFNATYTYAFSADIGGGPYERRQDMIEHEEETATVIEVAKGTAIDTLQKALNQWAADDKKACTIRIMDNGIYGGNMDIELPVDGWLQIQADNGVWPDVRLVGISSLKVASGEARLILDGLLVEGAFDLSGSLDLILQHCTLVPGRWLNLAGDPIYPDRDSLVVTTASAEMSVTIRKCILGPIRMPEITKCLAIEDSIVQGLRVGKGVRYAIAADDQGDEPGPPLVLDRVTVFGPVYAKELIRASEVIFTDEVMTERQQIGCVRFSYVPEGSLTPRRYHCQPDTAMSKEEQLLKRNLTAAERKLIRDRLEPLFTSRRYGEPGYAQIIRPCAVEIRTGAEDGSEMGAFASLKQPQREANLRMRLEEYLPFGLEAGFVFVT